jgi:acyl carrier protein
MSEDMEAAISRYVAKEMLKQPGRAIAPTEKLISSGLVDSFHLVDLALFVEDTFQVHLDDTELNAQTFDTLGELAALIRARQAGR